MSSQNGTAHVGLTYGQRLRERIIQNRHKLPEKAMRFPDFDLTDEEGTVVEEGWIMMRALTAAQRGAAYTSAMLPDPQPGKPNNTKLDTGRLMIWIFIFGAYAAIPDADEPTNPDKMTRDDQPLFSVADYQVVSELNGAIVQDAAQWVMNTSGLAQEALDDAKNASSPIVETTGWSLS